jgi:signal transduction histidine kinase
MAAGVAHDFNNVLGAILGRVQLIKLGLGRTEEGVGAMPHEALQRELSVIEQAALDGAHTIKKIQEFTRQKGNECLFVPLNMNEIVEGAIELMKTKIKDEADERGISIKVQTINNEISSVMGNPAELREVLINLMMNSIDAMPKGGTITFKTGTENGHVSIEVVDDGIGMPESVRKRIFDPFFTTKGVQRSGLGLSISYGIIHRHQGEIRAQSREGMGTTFRIELPISKKERDRREEENGERSSAIFHHPGH